MRSPVAVVFGLVCVVGTLIILFGHIRTIEDFTISHLYIMLALLVTLGAGHFMWDAFSHGWTGAIRGVSLTVLFVVGTIVCVGMSGGRSAAILEQKEADAEEAQKRRNAQSDRVERVHRRMAEAEARHKEAEEKAHLDTEAADAECASGKGTRCDGKRVTAQASTAAKDQEFAKFAQARNDYEGEERKLAEMAPPSPPNPELSHFAKVYAFISGSTEAQAKATVKLLFPYMLALLTEFGTIVFFKEGFGPKAPPPPAPPQTPEVTIGDIARNLNMKPHIARKLVRQLNIEKPPQGWAWSKPEAAMIEQRLGSARQTLEVRA